MQDDISKTNPAIAAYAQEWQRNRDVIDGARSVRARAQSYLPMMPGQALGQYNSFINRVSFFPAASRTHDGLMGLMFRKSIFITAPDAAKPILNTITSDGWDIETLARKVASELLTVSYGGLLVDPPVIPAGLSKKAAQDGNYRPFIGVYRAESIITVQRGVVNNCAVTTLVRLWDDTETIRELALIDGVYTVTIYTKTNSGSFVAQSSVTPLQNNKTMGEIPFTLISRDEGIMPVTAALSDVCDHNIQCYLAQSNLAMCHYFSSAPIYNVFNVEGTAADFPVYPGAIWLFKPGATPAQTSILEYKGAAISALRDAVQDIKEEMAAIGSRILAAEKVASESADALAIRRASENATLASMAKIVTRIVNSALEPVALWLGLERTALKIEVNTDYNAKELTDKEIVARMAMWQAGGCSLETFQRMMIDGEVLPEDFDAALDKSQREQEIADRPTLDLPQQGDAPATSAPGTIKVVDTATA